MFLIKLWNYIRGYVIIEVSGYFTEKFINICTRRQILLWDISWCDHGRLRMRMSIKAFLSIRPISKKSGCNVTLVAKQGLPFLVYRYRGRTGLLIGLALFILLLYFLTSMVWAIEVTGNKNIKTDIIISQLHETGIYRGKLKYGIKPPIIVHQLMEKNKLITWVGVELKGTKLKIEIVEGVQPPEIIPIDQPCDVVAIRDGIIHKINIMDGAQMVKEGETVLKGQILISGNVESIRPEFGVRQVHAMGQVVARTWYEVQEPVKTTIMLKERTGQYHDMRWVLLLDFKIPLPGRDIEYDQMEKIVFDKTLGKEGKYKLPLGLTVERSFELFEKEVILSEDEARNYALETALEHVYDKLQPEVKVLEESHDFKEDANGRVVAVATLECIEDIGDTQLIGALE